MYYQDDSVTLYHGKALDVARTLQDRSVDMICTSPPYFGLRDYGVEGQWGLEDSPAEYVENLRSLFAELRRVLADDGTVWLNIGDSYVGKPPGNVRGVSDRSGLNGAQTSERYRETLAAGMGTKRDTTGMGIAAKNLLGIPWRVAFALQDDGWIWRNTIVWSKPNAMPESVRDRLSTRWEPVMLFSKQARYWFDLDAIREPIVSTRADQLSWARDSKEAILPGRSGPSAVQHRNGRPGTTPSDTNPLGRNPGDVWEIPTTPFTGAHYAVMPRAVADRCVQAGCTPRRCTVCGHAPTPIVEAGDLVSSRDDPTVKQIASSADSGHVGTAATERSFAGGRHAMPRRERTTTGMTDCGHNAYRPGAVLDPFSGSGTTGLAAARYGKRYVGIDIDARSLDLSLTTRLAQGGLFEAAE